MADEENVPTYTEVDEGGITSWIDDVPERAAQLQLPLTQWPLPPWHPDSASQWTSLSASTLTPEDKDELWTTQKHIITTLFDAIRSKNVEVVTILINRGWVSPDVPNEHGETPLVAAVAAGNGSMICALVALGATVNTYGRFDGGERTPLMAAAATGRLPLVKLLIEDFHADDAIIAPDGQLALRLAADNGHRDVVAFLPARRGGAWRRWKVNNEVAVRRIRRAGYNIYRFFKFFLWELPKFFVWSIPKHLVVKPLVKACKYCWEHKRRFCRWCKRQVVEFPGRVKRAGKAVWKVAKKVPPAVWKVAKEVPIAVWKVMKWVPKVVWKVMKWIPKVVKALALAFWRFVKRIPGAMKMVGLWIWTTLKGMGKAVGNVFLRVVSAIHTAVMAVIDFFRSITLKDVLNGIRTVFRAIFVELPQAMWAGIKTAGEVAYKVVVLLFGSVGQLIWWFFEALLWVAEYVPHQLWKIICGIGNSMAKGYHEILVWFNPKR
ncbi:hypothetical protein B0H67DRAFT_562720 [Lasiosphaeris hirsuta]|uniref:Ankyrin n=1 Tax=Lasiosphaeris hirsuta TaxID=260670 RepID=A0AA40BAM1_9PEZI|nr:hypothetical protein B0H67DRAFT_562720 [Lasiosphaeris hirsuta]